MFLFVRFYWKRNCEKESKESWRAEIYEWWPAFCIRINESFKISVRFHVVTIRKTASSYYFWCKCCWGHYVFRDYRRLPPQNRLSVIQIDEFYLRVETNYRNGSVFGFADDRRPARTLLYYILYFLLKFETGGPIIPYKYCPIFTLNARTMFSYYKGVRDTIFESGGHVLAVITDNCRVNQRFLEMIEKEFQEFRSCETCFTSSWMFWKFTVGGFYIGCMLKATTALIVKDRGRSKRICLHTDC